MAEESKIKTLQKEFQIRKQKRLNIFLHVILCFVCQIVLVVVIAEYLYSSNPDAFLEVVGTDVLFCRFIAGTILHLSLLDEVTRGIHNLKFALNHPYLFQSYKLAATVGIL